MASGILLVYCIVLIVIGLATIRFGIKVARRSTDGGFVEALPGFIIVALGSALILWGARVAILGAW